MDNRKQPLLLTLSSEIVRRANHLSLDLNETVEALLTAFIAAKEAGAKSETAAIQQWIANSNAFIDEHGSPADEYCPF